MANPWGRLNCSESAGAAPQVLLTARGHRCRLLSVKGGNTGYAVNDHPRDANGGIENNPDCGDPDAAFNGVRFCRLYCVEFALRISIVAVSRATSLSGDAMVSHSNHRAT